MPSDALLIALGLAGAGLFIGMGIGEAGRLLALALRSYLEYKGK
jgi:hypothetical protein